MPLSVGTGIPCPWLRDKETKALGVVERWIDAAGSKVYGSVSGGKDSLVMGHLIRRVYPDCPLIWVNQGYMAEWPDCIELLDWLKGQGWKIIELCPVRDLWRLYADHGIPLDGVMSTKLDKIINQKLIYDPLNEYQEINGIQGYAWGLRQDESKNRARYMRNHGTLHHNKKGLWVCSPVGFWSTVDIWHYIDKYRIPYPSMYDRDRLTVRNGPPIGTTGINWGRIAELRRYHPEAYQVLSQAYGEVINHA